VYRVHNAAQLILDVGKERERNKIKKRRGKKREREGREGQIGRKRDTTY